PDPPVEEKEEDQGRPHPKPLDPAGPGSQKGRKALAEGPLEKEACEEEKAIEEVKAGKDQLFLVRGEEG
ncbi:hypothetical protein, partial [Klebsiella pneumoniae]|uniref:hypothetical protein n=1 Tax=Klebsiella pneumoniae TaxID=573 RepID=UPI003B5A2E48